MAGSDPSAGAGIQADLRLFALCGVHGLAAIAALTAQSGRGVRSVWPVPAAVLEAQLAALLEDVPIAAAKTGMLGTAGNVRVVARLFRRRRLPLVVDPVLAASSGRPLLGRGGLAVLRRELLPLASIATPNLPEASALLQREVRGLRGMREAARDLVRAGAGAALVKGGHRGGRPIDVLCAGGRIHEFEHERLPARHSRGTGCLLSSALAVGLGRGRELRDAVEDAITLVVAALARAGPLGRGRGPADPLRLVAGRFLLQRSTRATRA